MKRSIRYPVLLVGLPQALVWGFYGLLSLIGVPWGVRATICGIAGGIALLVTTIFAIVGLFAGIGFQDRGWLKDDEDEAQRLRARHEEEMRRLDAEIGIPRIPVRK